MPHSYLIELYYYGLSISFSDADTVSTLGYSNCGKKVICHSANSRANAYESPKR